MLVEIWFLICLWTKSGIVRKRRRLPFSWPCKFFSQEACFNMGSDMSCVGLYCITTEKTVIRTPCFTSFCSQLVAEFGTDHIYSCDTFNEMTPHTSNVTYLSEVSSAILTAITDVDPGAVW
jgi:alpha-N-acetylglucosaminidase